jgi:hypothetical protein
MSIAIFSTVKMNERIYKVQYMLITLSKIKR